ncbi:MAG: hypothetical protein ACREHC_01010 [Candidatus Levyibacteriota bacterium]
MPERNRWGRMRERANATLGRIHEVGDHVAREGVKGGVGSLFPDALEGAAAGVAAHVVLKVSSEILRLREEKPRPIGVEGGGLVGAVIYNASTVREAIGNVVYPGKETHDGQKITIRELAGAATAGAVGGGFMVGVKHH